MTAGTGAGTIYAFIVFLIGFILWTVRVLLIEAGLLNLVAVATGTHPDFSALTNCAQRSDALLCPEPP
jgi:hypothetical protein